ncbi:sugar ABC transporter substrate-binding protein [Microbacterium sp. Root61]|uniref:substrate-binding domain-containing protein n=1 Tax=Microbacterium sp. Root61 TaxID=1736570 RepID=UPI0006F9C39D|nr:substrate-binding domain-containing protein [Microbacterium sp. Root61]KRA24880.1 sugar ABC transporter substrate-binding protein [Microbacterium sp. Root61]
MANKKRMLGLIGFVGAGVLALGLTGCAGGGDDTGSDGGAGTDGDLTTVGFVAVGPEGGWRNANEQAIKDAFTEEAGFELKYAPAASPSDQKSQLDAFATFVNDEVDVILLTATEASGWEDSLKLAQEAEIPVILLDRGVDASEDLYVTRIAPDNFQVAASVGAWTVETFPEGANYFVLEGVPGLSVVNERNEGFDSEVGSVASLNKVGAQTANWKTDEGKSVIETVLKANNNDIQFIFAQNDEMGIGAAQAVTAAGLVPGTDVKIATIDGTTGALEALAAGQLSFVAQYNPFFGDIAVDAVNKTLAGEKVESVIIVDSATFDSAEAGEKALADGQGF